MRYERYTKLLRMAGKVRETSSSLYQVTDANEI